MLEPRCDNANNFTRGTPAANAYNKDMRPQSMMSMRAERSPGVKSTNAAAGTPAKKKTDLRKVWPEVWKLVRPRRFILLGGLVNILFVILVLLIVLLVLLLVILVVVNAQRREMSLVHDWS